MHILKGERQLSQMHLRLNTQSALKRFLKGPPEGPRLLVWINISVCQTLTSLNWCFDTPGGWPADCARRWHQSTRWQKMLKSILNAMCRKPFWFQFLIHTYMCSVKTRVSYVVETLLIHVHTVLTHEHSALCTIQATKTKTKTKTKYTLWTPQANMTYLRSTSPPYTGTQTRLRGGCNY